MICLVKSFLIFLDVLDSFFQAQTLGEDLKYAFLYVNKGKISLTKRLLYTKNRIVIIDFFKKMACSMHSAISLIQCFIALWFGLIKTIRFSESAD